jgi:hypothetical protein
MSNFIWQKSIDKLRKELEAIELPEYGIKTTNGKKQGKRLAFDTPVKMLDAITDYFNAVDANPYKEHDYVGKDATSVYRQKMRPYTWHGLCLFLGYNPEYFEKFEEYTREEIFRGGSQYRRVIKHARALIYDNKLSGATSGLFSHHIVARDLGLADKKQLEGGDKPIQLLGGDSTKTIPEA